MQIKAMRGKVLVSEIEGGVREVRGVIVLDDNGKSEGIRPRWAKVASIGEGVQDIEVGQWVLMEHGRWTRPMKVKDDNGVEQTYWAIDWPDGAMLVSDEKPDFNGFSQFSSCNK